MSNAILPGSTAKDLTELRVVDMTSCVHSIYETYPTYLYLKMQLPAWIHSGSEVWYVYTEVYHVDADKFELVRRGVCKVAQGIIKILIL